LREVLKRKKIVRWVSLPNERWPRFASCIPYTNKSQSAKIKIKIKENGEKKLRGSADGRMPVRAQKEVEKKN
jgi:hypothetical protein